MVKNYKSVNRSLSEYLKNSYLYSSVYMLTNRRTVRSDWSGGSSFAVFYPPLIMGFILVSGNRFGFMGCRFWLGVMSGGRTGMFRIRTFFKKWAYVFRLDRSIWQKRWARAGPICKGKWKVSSSALVMNGTLSWYVTSLGHVLYSCPLLTAQGGKPLPKRNVNQ